ncbi:MAG: hypothetical protein IKN05_08910, partial [Clostridia bacterium]|nr:hypothetical protein [Clostridia bacterium]
RERRASDGEADLTEAARALIAPVKEFVALAPAARMEAAQAFCDDIAERIGELEARLEENED